MGCVQDESGAAVLHGDPGIRHHDPRAEAHVVRLDHRHHGAVAVRRGEIDRVVADRQRHGGQRRCAGSDRGRGGGDGLGVEQFLGRPAHRTGVGEVIEGGSYCDFHRFHLDVRPLGGAGCVARCVEVGEDGQCDLRGEPLPVGRNLSEFHVPVGLADGGDPFRLVGGEVRCTHGSAIGSRRGVDPCGQGAAVERLAVACGDLFERRCEGGVAEHFARSGRAPGRQEVALKLGERPECVAGVGPDGCRLMADVEAVPGVADSRFEKICERESAETSRQGDPCAHRPWYGHRVPASRRHVAVAAETRGRPAGGRLSGRVQADEVAVPADDRERVAPDAVVAWLHHGQGDGGGDGRIHGIAAAAQHLQSGTRGQRLRRRHDVARQHGGAAGRVRERPVEHVSRHAGDWPARTGRSAGAASGPSRLPRTAVPGTAGSGRRRP